MPASWVRVATWYGLAVVPAPPANVVPVPLHELTTTAWALDAPTASTPSDRATAAAAGMD